jgi:hypothetical protein
MAQMRGQFPFPPTAPQIQGMGAVIALASGQAYYPPQGNYLVETGDVTVLQWYDPQNNMWRTYCQSGELTTFSTDGGNYRLVNMSGCIVGASITNAGSGGVNGIGPVQTGTTLTFAAGGTGAGLTAQGYAIVGGSVPVPTINNGGSGFLVPPLIFCDPPPQGGVQATFTATISAGGVITAINQVNAGAGYTSIPQFYVVPQWQFYNGEPRFPGDVAIPPVPATSWAPGLINPANLWNGSPYQGNLSSTSGAQLTGNALTGSGTLTGIVMTSFGGGYTGAASATVTLGGTSIGAAAATAVFAFSLIGGPITGSGGTGYVVGMPAITTLGEVVLSINNSVLFGRPGRGKVTNATGPVFSIEDPGFGIQSASGVGIGGGPATALGSVPAANLGGITDFSCLQGSVQ